jgi:hypothetical protein
MPMRTTTFPTRPGPIVDPHSITRGSGRQIDWAAVASGRINANTGKKEIAPYTVMCEVASGKIIPRADRAGAETATCLLEAGAVEDEPTAALSGYGIIVGGIFYENLLPDAAGGPPKVLPTAYKTELQAAGVGTGFAFEQYGDNRA